MPTSAEEKDQAAKQGPGTGTIVIASVAGGLALLILVAGIARVIWKERRGVR